MNLNAIIHQVYLREEYQQLVDVFGKELSQARQMFDANLFTPPMHKNMPPVASTLLWAFALKRRIQVTLSDSGGGLLRCLQIQFEGSKWSLIENLFPCRRRCRNFVKLLHSCWSPVRGTCTLNFTKTSKSMFVWSISSVDKFVVFIKYEILSPCLTLIDTINKNDN